MSNELTDVRCPCGAEFQADSYDAGFIAGSGMCQNCDAAMPPKDIPAPVEQAGGDEREEFELFVRKHCGMPEHIAVNWDAKFTNDAWEGWQARAALAQPSPKCATCGGTGMVDDGEITCSEGGIPYENGPVKCVKDCPDCKAQPSPPPHPAPELDFSRPLETENGDPVKWICADVIEYKSARVCVAKDTGLVYSSPYIGLKIRNVMPEQAEAERSALWAVHAQGPDELYAAFSREDAEKHAAELNALPMPEGIAVGAVVVPSPWPAVQHWQYLAEQEQDHKNEIAGRLRQHERIGEALRAEITQLRQHKNDYMDAGQETYRALQNEIREREAEIARLDGLVSGHTAERDAALARVAELERKLRNEENAHTTTIEQRDNAEHWADQLANAIAERFGVDIGEHSNLNCPWNEALVWMQQPPAQAQHSVPEGVTIERDVAGTIHIKVGDFDFIQLQYQRPYTDNASTWKLAERIASLLAAAPGKAQPKETPEEILAAKLIETWVAKHGKPAPWSKIVEITALATSMPNDERDRLLALDDDVDAQAQHSVPEEFIGRLSEFLAQRGATGKALLRELRTVLASAPGKEGL